MGRLIRRLQEVGQPTQAMETSLAEVLKARNWLAHGYFADRALEFNAFDGRGKMIEELENIQEQFQCCAAELDAISLPAARALGFTDEMLERVQAEMTAAYAARTEA